MGFLPRPKRVITEPPQGRRDFWVFVSSGLFARGGDQLFTIAVPLSVLAATESVAGTVLAFSARVAAYLLSPFIGVLIDSFDRRDVYILAQFYQALCLGLIALFLDDVLVLAVLVLLSGLGAVVANISSYFVLVPRLVTAERRSKALSDYSALREIVRIIGPLSAGGVVVLAGGATALVLTCALFALSALVALFVPRVVIEDEEAPEPGEKPRRALAVGFAWLWRNGGAVALVAAMTLANIGVGTLDVIFITLLGDSGMPATGIGLVVSIGAVGAAGGTWAAGRLFPQTSFPRRVLYWQLVALAGVTVMAVPVLPVRVAGYVVTTFALGASNINSIRYRQESIPMAISGRVNSVMRMFITGAIPVSAMVWAAVHQWAPAELHWTPVVLFSALGVAVWWWHLARSGRSADQPDGAAGEAPKVAAPDPLSRP
jgi:hypothetical protein